MTRLLRYLACGLPLAILSVALGLHLSQFKPSPETAQTESLPQPEQRPKITAEWSNHPDHLFRKDNWWYVTPGGEIIGTVRRYDSDNPWSAYVRGAGCKSGEFTSMTAAKYCVEDHFK